jgi:transposase
MKGIWFLRRIIGVYTDMEQWHTIRKRVLVEGVSKRQIMRETGLHFKTLNKILNHSWPPGYRRTAPVRKPKIGPFVGYIAEILEQDKTLPKKQRHTIHRIWQRLTTEHGFTGGYTIVGEAVRALRQKGREVFMPLVHRPGEAQVDFGQGLVKMDGVLRKVSFFVMILPHSDAFFVMAFPSECTETFLEGHVRAFGFFKAVPRRITYDNTTVCVSKIIGSRERNLTAAFKHLLSHYLFDYHFCLVRRPNEKGVVEGIVRFTRQNFFVPVPQVRDFDDLNLYLLERCREDLTRKLRGKAWTKGQLLAEDREAMQPLPQIPLEACRIESGRANSLSLVRFGTNDYSVPVQYAHHPVLVKGYSDRVVIGYGSKVIAEHRRCWQKQQAVFDPIHYLPLLKKKPHSLDHALPLQDLGLAGCFDVLRRRLEQEPDRGIREYIRVLLLLEHHSPEDLARAVEKALTLRVHSRDAIAQFLTPPEPWRQTTFRLEGREHLRRVKIDANHIAAYRQLLDRGGVA